VFLSLSKQLEAMHLRQQQSVPEKANERVQFGYGLNYVIDIESAITVDVEGTPPESMKRLLPRRP
jgi:hypothetical protein